MATTAVIGGAGSEYNIISICKGKGKRILPQSRNFAASNLVACKDLEKL